MLTDETDSLPRIEDLLELPMARTRESREPAPGAGDDVADEALPSACSDLRGLPLGRLTRTASAALLVSESAVLSATDSPKFL